MMLLFFIIGILIQAPWWYWAVWFFVLLGD